MLAAAVLAVLWALYRPFVLVSFDRRRAASLGVPVERTELALMVLLAVAVVVGFTVVGRAARARPPDRTGRRGRAPDQAAARR